MSHRIFQKIILFSLISLIGITPSSYAYLPIAPCHSFYAKNSKLAFGGHYALLGNKRMYYRILGHGSPVIIFSSGTGFPADAWYDSGITKSLSKTNRVLTYDRLYTFNSCPNTNNYMPNTAKDVVTRLRLLLQKANLKPPYILVGHSFGGLYILLYAREYPNEVAGLLLMDPTSDAGPTPLPKDALLILKKKGNPQHYIATDPLYNEGIGQLPSYLQMRNAKPLPKNMPLVMMIATKHCLPRSLTDGKLMCMTKAEEANHVKNELAIYNMSQNHVLYMVNGSHMSFFDKSKHQIMMQALHRLIKMVHHRLVK